MDKAKKEVRENLYDKMKDATTFPQIFNVANEAFSEAAPRQGRPSNKCILSFVLCINNFEEAQNIASVLAGKLLEEPNFDNEIAKIYTLTDGYCKQVLGDSNKSEMLESEFTMNLIILSDLWFAKLLGGDRAKEVAIETLKALIDVNNQSKITKCKELLDVDGAIANDELNKFWGLGATRANRYEPLLKSYFSRYNHTFSSSTNKRPDILVSEYVPCSLLIAATKQEIKDMIKRTCHAIEITSIKDADGRKVKDYLKKKLPNYIELIMES